MENLRIYWGYGKYNPIVKEQKSTEERDTTTCVVETADGVQIAVGRVFQYYKDAPNRKLARRESFKKAVSQLPTREERKMAWSVFNEKFPKCVNCN